MRRIIKGVTPYDELINEGKRYSPLPLTNNKLKSFEPASPAWFYSLLLKGC
jgi:hypothetical protein